MNSKNITKLVLAVALIFTVTFSQGVSDELLHTSYIPEAHAGCIGGSSGGSGSGGGC